MPPWTPIGHLGSNYWRAPAFFYPVPKGPILTNGQIRPPYYSKGLTTSGTSVHPFLDQRPPGELNSLVVPLLVVFQLENPPTQDLSSDYAGGRLLRTLLECMRAAQQTEDLNYYYLTRQYDPDKLFVRNWSTAYARYAESVKRE